MLCYLTFKISISWVMGQLHETGIKLCFILWPPNDQISCQVYVSLPSTTQRVYRLKLHYITKDYPIYIHKRTECNQLKPFIGTFKVHQLTGNLYDLGFRLCSVVLLMKQLNCFCNDNHCQHFIIVKIYYGVKL